MDVSYEERLIKLYSIMKPRHFKIRNFHDDQSVRVRMASQAAEYPDKSDVVDSNTDRVTLNDLNKIIKEFMTATTLALTKGKEKGFEVEPRDREVESKLPTVEDGRVDHA